MLAEDAAHHADDPRTVLMPADKKAAFRHQIDPKRIDPYRAGFAHEQRPGDLVTLHPQGDQARVAAVGSAPSLDQLDAPIARDEPRVDGVDPILGERLDQALDGRGDQQVDVVIGELAFEIELENADPAAEQLPMQRRQSLGQLRERTDVGKLFRGQSRCIDGKAREVPRQDRSHFLCNVKRD